MKAASISRRRRLDSVTAVSLSRPLRLSCHQDHDSRAAGCGLKPHCRCEFQRTVDIPERVASLVQVGAKLNIEHGRLTHEPAGVLITRSFGNRRCHDLGRIRERLLPLWIVPKIGDDTEGVTHGTVNVDRELESQERPTFRSGIRRLCRPAIAGGAFRASRHRAVEAAPEGFPQPVLEDLACA